MPNHDDLAKARAEAAVLLRIDDPEHATPADNLRIDLVTTLRASIDHTAASVLDGDGRADLGRLIIAVEALTKLLPVSVERGRHRGAGPREKILRMVMAAKAADAVEEERETERLKARIAELEAENARLRGTTPKLLPAPEAFEQPVDGEIVEPERQAAPPSPPPQPARPFVNGLSDVPRHVRDSRPANEPWRPYSHLFE